MSQQAFQAIQTAYIRLLRNPFYVPDDHDPKLSKNTGALLTITNSKFIDDIERIGRKWYPGVTNL